MADDQRVPASSDETQSPGQQPQAQTDDTGATIGSIGWVRGSVTFLLACGAISGTVALVEWLFELPSEWLIAIGACALGLVVGYFGIFRPIRRKLLSAVSDADARAEAEQQWNRKLLKQLAKEEKARNEKRSDCAMSYRITGSDGDCESKKKVVFEPLNAIRTLTERIHVMDGNESRQPTMTLVRYAGRDRSKQEKPLLDEAPGTVREQEGGRAFECFWTLPAPIAPKSGLYSKEIISKFVSMFPGTAESIRVSITSAERWELTVRFDSDYAASIVDADSGGVTAFYEEAGSRQRVALNTHNSGGYLIFKFERPNAREGDYFDMHWKRRE